VYLLRSLHLFMYSTCRCNWILGCTCTCVLALHV